jgi:hypothetical protein
MHYKYAIVEKLDEYTNNFCIFDEVDKIIFHLRLLHFAA